MRLIDILSKERESKSIDSFLGGLYIGFTAIEEFETHEVPLLTPYDKWMHDKDAAQSKLRKKGAEYLLKYTPTKEDEIMNEIFSRKSTYMLGALIGFMGCPIHGVYLGIKKIKE